MSNIFSNISHTLYYIIISLLMLSIYFFFNCQCYQCTVVMGEIIGFSEGNSLGLDFGSVIQLTNWILLIHFHSCCISYYCHFKKLTYRRLSYTNDLIKCPLSVYANQIVPLVKWQMLIKFMLTESSIAFKEFWSIRIVLF